MVGIKDALWTQLGEVGGATLLISTSGLIPIDAQRVRRRCERRPFNAGEGARIQSQYVEAASARIPTTRVREFPFETNQNVVIANPVPVPAGGTGTGLSWVHRFVL